MDWCPPRNPGRKRVYVADSSGAVTALDVDGARHQQVWTTETGGGSHGAPALGPDGAVYQTSGTSLTALRDEGDQVSTRWTKDLAEDLVEVSAAVAPDGTVAAPKRPRSRGVWTSAAVDVSHRMYFGTRRGHVFGYSPDGTQLFDIDSGETIDSHPALTGDGALVVGATSGVLYATADD